MRRTEKGEEGKGFSPSPPLLFPSSFSVFIKIGVNYHA
jgi:hypothetical protein